MPAGFEVHRPQLRLRLRGQGQRHRDRLGFGARKILQILFGEAMEEPLDFAGEQNQRIPGAIHGKIIAARIKYGHLPPELRHGAQDLELAGKKLFVKHRDLNVFLNSLHPAQTNGEVIHITTQHTPAGFALRPVRQSLEPCRR